MKEETEARGQTLLFSELNDKKPNTQFVSSWNSYKYKFNTARDVYNNNIIQCTFQNRVLQHYILGAIVNNREI